MNTAFLEATRDLTSLTLMSGNSPAKTEAERNSVAASARIFFISVIRSVGTIPRQAESPNSQPLDPGKQDALL